MLTAWLHRRSAWLFHAATALGFGGPRALAAWIMYALRLPVAWLPQLAGFGRLTNRDEFASILDNFFVGVLRYDPMEQCLRATPDALVLDVGVNVGITVRWWLHLNPRTQVIAVDMMREAHEFAACALAQVAPNLSAQVHYVEAAVGNSPGSTEITFDNPLEGTNAASALGGATRRRLAVRTLDDIWAEALAREVTLLKLDIEGAGGTALAGAAQVLRRTRFVAAEWHNAGELAHITSACVGAGLSLVSANAKMLFFERLA